jgi:hypothetical protein
MDTAKYFQNGLAEIVEIRHTGRSVEILSFDIFLNFLIVIYLTSSYVNWAFWYEWTRLKRE